MINPESTTRAVIDVGRKCNLNCKFCYHHHLGNLSKQNFETFEKLKKEIDNAYNRGNNYLDFTGGEPTMHPQICELIEYALKNYKMKSCIITNGLCNEKTFLNICNVGVDGFLLSVHGMQVTHDILTCKGAREKQIVFLERLENYNKTLEDQIELRFNFVISSYSYEEIDLLSSWTAQYNPSIVNFINFNPHHGWSKDKKETQKTIADLYKVKHNLQAGIKYLESKNIGVNIRYYPMCLVDEEYRKNICNDLHVLFDPYEWDYERQPKTPEVFLDSGILMSKNAELHKYPCNDCDLQNICGGINALFFEAMQETDMQEIEPVKDLKLNKIDKNYFYHYRQHNDLCLQRRA